MKDCSIKRVLVIGSGPIIIGQAAEFDYAGVQACKTLKDEGIEVVLLNSNPATIMTDKEIADKIYIDPINVEIVEQIIAYERPDSMLATLGGQTGLNLAMELYEKGILDKHGVRLLGTDATAIKKAEDRDEFKKTMQNINEPIPLSAVVNNIEGAVSFASKAGYPVIVRPAYTLGGSGGGIASNEEELIRISNIGLAESRVNQVLIEESIAGWKEIEYEVIRDKNGNTIIICNMENFDPVGVHTGDSIVVAPSQTLSDYEHQMLRNASIKIITALNIEGGCNVQFALNPQSYEYKVIEVNPRVSRSSALASKATGYPIAKVSTLIAIGYTLDEIKNSVTKKTVAMFEPALDYIVVKIPKWPFDKFVKADRSLWTQMKATGEVMSIGDSFEAAFLKAVRSLELNMYHLDSQRFTEFTNTKIEDRIKTADDERFLALSVLLRRGVGIDKLYELTMIDRWFLKKLKNIITMEESLKAYTIKTIDMEILNKAKKMGFSDVAIAYFIGSDENTVRAIRETEGIMASYRMVDTCSGEFEAYTPYYYSDYSGNNEAISTQNKKMLIIGSGPIRIGQGIEFDYCTVHAVWAFKKRGYETIIINNNPETVSTDFDTADRLYFEPLTFEDVYEVIRNEKPDGIVLQFGGQTAIKLAEKLSKTGIKIYGTGYESINMAEDRKEFDAMLEKLNIKRPKGYSVLTKEEALLSSNSLGYPVLIRPSYVLGGKGMVIAYSDSDVEEYMDIINEQGENEHPVLVDKYIKGTEAEVDLIFDGKDILVPGIMEHIEKTGIHSGDSISVYPPFTISQKVQEDIVKCSEKIARELNVIGLVNIQFIVREDDIYIIEVNPRSSRTVPYLSKVTGIPMIDIAVGCMCGEKIAGMGFGVGKCKDKDYYAVKVPVFSFEKLKLVEPGLGPEMKSTGETLGISYDLNEALLKGISGAGIKIGDKKKALLTVADKDKADVLEIAKELHSMDYLIYATKKTGAYLMYNDIPCNVLDDIDRNENVLLDIIKNRELDIIVNTPTRGREPDRFGYKIRRLAAEKRVACLTSVDTAKAVVKALKSGVKQRIFTDLFN
ncbi:carbamoyl-phosphate synthase large chain [Oxobacter pfennigii]|uniref:Carbamoyl phosphate synthase large chain n=1 Tax=Oxobacter pfennigii TaxID=36849 RepID=A0A0P8X586_9CLOT|nr:carbamoyl-phosphate synthase (glutamine-hydrolyzing) large subunit [Oxobacter pfennigii]KPU45956.1 carbamoyl-phosphate synthase large chain [Oxobacter pfennigii]